MAENFVLSSLMGANSVPPNHQAGFGGHFAAGGEMGREGSEEKGKGKRIRE